MSQEIHIIRYHLQYCISRCFQTIINIFHFIIAPNVLLEASLMRKRLQYISNPCWTPSVTFQSSRHDLICLNELSMSKYSSWKRFDRICPQFYLETVPFIRPTSLVLKRKHSRTNTGQGSHHGGVWNRNATQIRVRLPPQTTCNRMRVKNS